MNLFYSCTKEKFTKNILFWKWGLTYTGHDFFFLGEVKRNISNIFKAKRFLLSDCQDSEIWLRLFGQVFLKKAFWIYEAIISNIIWLAKAQGFCEMSRLIRNLSLQKFHFEISYLKKLTVIMGFVLFLLHYKKKPTEKMNCAGQRMFPKDRSLFTWMKTNCQFNLPEILRLFLILLTPTDFT